MNVLYAITRCPLGRALVAQSEQGVCCVLLGDDEAQLASALAAEFPDAHLVRDDDSLRETTTLFSRVLDGTDSAAAVPLDLRGTEFQRRVWNALRAVPRGSTVSYSEMAERIGAPRAVRAVASACAANRLAVLVPCHRVVRGDGSLGGYRWGLERKRSLLERERMPAGTLLP